MPTELILIRHGDALRGQGDYFHAPLTDLGRQQAVQTGRHLKAYEPLGGFYTSPLRRAAETAEIIGAQIGKTATAKPDIREMGFRELAVLAVLGALSLLDPVEDYLQAHAGKPIRWPMQGRVSRALTEMVTLHPDQRVVVVAHSGVISSTLAWLFPEQRLRWWTTVVGNCSLTRLQVDRTQAALLAVAEVQHLAPAVATAQLPSRAANAAAHVLQRNAGRLAHRG